MKFKKIIPALLVLFLAGCRPTPSEEIPPSSEPPVSQTTSEIDPTSETPSVTSEDPVTTEEPSVTTEEPSVTSEDPLPVDNADYAAAFALLDQKPEYHPANKYKIQTLVASKTGDVLTLKVARTVNNLTANNDNWWDGNQIDLFVDLNNDKTTELGVDDVHFLIRPDGFFAFRVASTTTKDWSDWAEGSWGANGVFGVHVTTEVAPYSFANTYVARVGINLSLFDFTVGTHVGVATDLIDDTAIKNPSLYDAIPVYDENSSFAVGEHVFSDRTVNVISTPKAYNLTLKRTVNSFVDDLWNGESNIFLLFAGDALTAGTAPSADDLKLISAHTGYGVATVGNGTGWADPWLPGSWGSYSTHQDGVWYSIAIDGNDITYTVSIALSTLQMNEPASSVRLMGVAGAHENDPSLWQEVVLAAVE